jgi:hypothetical protein
MISEVASDRFRVQFILHDGLSQVQFVPMVNRDESYADVVRGGMLRGAAALLDFINAIGLDSFVTLRETSKTLHFVREWHRQTPKSILEWIESRLQAERDAEDKILNGEILTDRDKVALSTLSTFVLGASTLTCAEGLGQIASWLRDHGE